MLIRYLKKIDLFMHCQIISLLVKYSSTFGWRSPGPLSQVKVGLFHLAGRAESVCLCACPEKAAFNEVLSINYVLGTPYNLFGSLF